MLNIKQTTGVVVAVFLLAGCGEGDLIENPMIDRWCGDRPCAWEVSGRVERVGTWHTDDYAVELGRDTTLSQHNAVVDADDATCLGFSMIADVSRSARLFVELDFLDDGVIDFSQQMPETHWERRTFLIATPSWYEGVRFIVRKSGSGRAVLAELRAYEAAGCKREPVKLLNRPEGAKCESDDQCGSDRCRGGRCSYCDRALHCAAGQICGLAYSSGRLAERCVRPGSAVFGQVCSSDAQCASGSVCCSGVCSQCCPGDKECENDVACERGTDATLLGDIKLPFQCGSRAGMTPLGGPCVLAEDCQGRRCSGVEVTCAECQRDPDEDAGVAADPSACQLQCSEWTFRGGMCD